MAVGKILYNRPVHDVIPYANGVNYAASKDALFRLMLRSHFSKDKPTDALSVVCCRDDGYWIDDGSSPESIVQFQLLTAPDISHYAGVVALAKAKHSKLHAV